MEDEKTARIQQLNDAFRTTFEGGRITLTQGISSCGEIFVLAALAEVKTFSDFSEDNDPNHEHDFGSFEIESQTLFWKIDYYAHDMEHGSEDPSDVTQTTRLLTIMLAEEY